MEETIEQQEGDNQPAEDTVNNHYKTAALSTLLEKDEPNLELVNSVEEGLIKELEAAKRLGDSKKDIELTRELMSLNDLKNDWVRRLNSSQDDQEHKEENTENIQAEDPYNENVEEFVTQNPWLNKKDERYSPELTELTENYVQELNTYLKEAGQGDQIGSREYFNHISKQIEDYVVASSKDSVSPSRENREKTEKNTFSLSKSIDSYLENQKTTIPPDRINLWRKMEVYDGQGKKVINEREKLSSLNQYHSIAKKYTQGDSNHLSLQVPKDYGIPVSAKKRF